MSFYSYPTSTSVSYPPFLLLFHLFSSSPCRSYSSNLPGPFLYCRIRDPLHSPYPSRYSRSHPVILLFKSSPLLFTFPTRIKLLLASRSSSSSFSIQLLCIRSFILSLLSSCSSSLICDYFDPITLFTSTSFNWSHNTNTHNRTKAVIGGTKNGINFPRL